MALVIRSINRAGIVTWLATRGVSNASEILEGFGFSKNRTPTVFEVELEAGDELLQWIGNPSAELGIARGRWYALKGATMDRLGIFSGGAGRSLHRFEVTAPCRALEGDAAELGSRATPDGPRVKISRTGDATNGWKFGLGGSGGATQIFVPRIYDGHIASLGPTS